MKGFRIGPSYNLTIAGTAANSAPYASQIQQIRVATTDFCRIAIGPNAVATTDDMLLVPEEVEFFTIAAGDRVSILAEGGSTGTVNVTEST